MLTLCISVDSAIRKEGITMEKILGMRAKRNRCLKYDIEDDNYIVKDGQIYYHHHTSLYYRKWMILLISLSVCLLIVSGFIYANTLLVCFVLILLFILCIFDIYCIEIVIEMKKKRDEIRNSKE